MTVRVFAIQQRFTGPAHDKMAYRVDKCNERGVLPLEWAAAAGVDAICAGWPARCSHAQGGRTPRRDAPDDDCRWPLEDGDFLPHETN